MMLRGCDQRDRHALICAKAWAAKRVIFDLARGRGAHRSHPAGKLGHSAFRPLGAERTGIFVPAVLPAGNVAGVIAGEPAPEADADQPLGTAPWRNIGAPRSPAGHLLINLLMEAHYSPLMCRPLQ